MFDHHIILSQIIKELGSFHLYLASLTCWVYIFNKIAFLHGQLCKIRLDIRKAVLLPVYHGCCGSTKTGHSRIW